MKSKSSTKPIYAKEVEGAAANANSVYGQNKASIQAGADQFASVIPSILDRYKGDPTIGAARAHYGDVLSGKYLSEGNPNLQAIIDQTGNDVRNGAAASLGTRGLTGGSDYAGIISRELAKNATGLRYDDYNRQSDRMDNAAASVGSISDAEGSILGQALAAYQAQTAPVMAANDNASTIGGLLGQYTKTKQSQGLGTALAALGGSALSSWASGGFKRG